MPRRVVRVEPEVGEDETLRRGVAAIQAELGVTPAFPGEVLAEAERAAREPRLPSLDRTDVPFVTIDPPGSMDLDQAMHLERDGAGYRVRYAIADVPACGSATGPAVKSANRSRVSSITKIASETTMQLQSGEEKSRFRPKPRPV